MSLNHAWQRTSTIYGNIFYVDKCVEHFSVYSAWNYGASIIILCIMPNLAFKEKHDFAYFAMSQHSITLTITRKIDMYTRNECFNLEQKEMLSNKHADNNHHIFTLV